MKKWLSLTLAIVMAVLLIGCNDEQGDGNGKKELSRGKIEESVYTNEYLGFKFTKPESWVYSTDEEIAEAVNLSVDLLLGENFEDTLANNTTVYDMMVIDTLTRTNINVGYENLSKSFSSNITINQYIEALKSQFANISGMTVTFPDTYETVKLGDVEFARIVCTTKIQATSMKQVYYLHKEGTYMCNVIVTIPSGYTVEQIEAMFE